MPLAAARARAALVLCTFVISSFASLIHEATTRHARCAEHGELVHSDSASALTVSPSAPAAIPARAAPRSDETVANSLHPAAAADAHHHCFVGCVARERVAAAPRVAINTAALPDPGTHIRPIAPLHASGLARYRTAPKTSPPV